MTFKKRIKDSGKRARGSFLGWKRQLSDFNRRASVTLEAFVTKKLSSGKGNVVTFCTSGHVYFTPEYRWGNTRPRI